MIGKVLKLSNNLEYCVLEELTYDSKKYIMAFQVDNDSDTHLDNFIVCEVLCGLNEDYKLQDIKEDKLFKQVCALLLQKFNQ